MPTNPTISNPQEKIARRPRFSRERRRNHKTTVCMDDAEDRVIRWAARQSGLAVANYVRQAAVELALQEYTEHVQAERDREAGRRLRESGER